jgi:hypothetical protein
VDLVLSRTGGRMKKRDFIQEVHEFTIDVKDIDDFPFLIHSRAVTHSNHNPTCKLYDVILIKKPNSRLKKLSLLVQYTIDIRKEK